MRRYRCGATVRSQSQWSMLRSSGCHGRTCMLLDQLLMRVTTLHSLVHTNVAVPLDQVVTTANRFVTTYEEPVSKTCEVKVWDGWVGESGGGVEACPDGRPPVHSSFHTVEYRGANNTLSQHIYPSSHALFKVTPFMMAKMMGG